MNASINNIRALKTNIIALWGAFRLGSIVSDLKSCFHQGGLDIKSAIKHIETLIKRLMKFMLAAVVLLEQVIELVALAYAAVLLTASMPFAISVLGSALLIAAGSYVLIFNDSSNLLHGFMPAFLKGPSANHKHSYNSEIEDLAKSSVYTICLQLFYLALRVILVAASFGFIITQLHNISFVAGLLAASSAIVPALKLIGVYLATLGASYVVAELYAKISISITSSKESNNMLVAIASLMSMLCAVPLGIYASASFLSVVLPLLVVTMGGMRAAFVAAIYVNKEFIGYTFLYKTSTDHNSSDDNNFQSGYERDDEGDYTTFTF